jgi:uncharacterized tellurite resistance protein B-like protein
MLERLTRLLRRLSGEVSARPKFVFDEDDHRVAAAGLLVHAMNADGVRSPAELTRLKALLKERFSLDEDEVDALIEAADRQNRQSIDFNAFTGTVRRAYNADGRRRIVEMMWEIVFADGTLHEFEDNLVWRVAAIIDVSEDERNAIRQRVAAARNIALADGDA